MIVDLKKLPNDVIKQLPKSLYLNNDKINIEGLTSDLQYLLREYSEDEKETIDNTNTIEIEPYLDEYNDFKKLRKVKTFLLQTIRNYIGVGYGNYPFDPDYGNRVKEYLHSKDTSLQNTLLANELSILSNILTRDFDYSIEIIKLNLDKKEYTERVEINYTCEIKILDTVETIKDTLTI